MNAIRPIRADEADDFLELLCGTFGLDVERSSRFFYEEPFFDLKRKWALFEGRKMISILTVTPLTFGWGKAIGIAGVATRSDRRDEGLASQLLRHVLREATRAGEGPALLFAVNTKVYEKVGFEAIDQVIRAPIPSLQGEDCVPTMLENSDVRAIYDRWAAAHPDRLRRDELRWRYWKWHMRTCTPFRSGYVCAEPGLLREAIFSPTIAPLPLFEGTEWLGTTRMADELGFIFSRATLEMTLMGYQFPSVPQLFLTDQF